MRDGEEEKEKGSSILLVSNSTHLKYVKVPENVFYQTTGYTVEPSFLGDPEIVAFKPDVRVLAIAEIEKGYPCLITERASGHMVFLQLDVIDNVLELRELNDKGVEN